MSNELSETTENITVILAKINHNLEDLPKDIIDIKLGQAEIQGRLSVLESNSQKIPDLAEKVGELKNWKQIGLTLFGTILGGIITYLVKTPNP